MKRFSLLVGIAPAAAILLAVSACAPAVHSTSAPTAHPNATVKPHPVKTQAAVPTVRVPVKCASLFTDAVAATLIDVPVKVHVDETTPPVDIVDIAPRQYGTLDCVWGGGRQDSG